MKAPTVKDSVLASLARLPDDVDMEEIMYHLYVQEKVEKGLEDIKEGRVEDHDKVMAELRQRNVSVRGKHHVD